MASIEALARRRGRALERLSSASNKAAEKFGVEAPSLDFNKRDPELGRVELVERVAAFLERLVGDVEVVDAEPEGGEGKEEGKAEVAATSEPKSKPAAKSGRKSAKKAKRKR
jgi:hypothetical protein